jgi:hypothetical protein
MHGKSILETKSWCGKLAGGKVWDKYSVVAGT